MKFSLRLLLVVVAIGSAIMGLGVRAYEAGRQRRILSELEAKGCWLEFHDGVESRRDLGVWDMHALSKVKSLHASNTFLTDITVVAEMDRLERLSLAPGTIDLAPLRKVTSLKYLSCEGMWVANDYSPLGELRNLEHLNLESAKIRDLSPLAKLEKLEDLNLNFTVARNFEHLIACKKLRILTLHQPPLVHRRSIPPINDAQLGVIAQIENLELLDISNSTVRSLAPLEKLRNLRWLSMAGTSVSSLAPLCSLEALEKVDLAYAKVSEEEVADLRRCLPGCKVIYPDYHAAPTYNTSDRGETGTGPVYTPVYAFWVFKVTATLTPGRGSLPSS